MIILIVLWFISGAQSAGRMAIGYNYFVEFAPVSAHDYMGTLWNISEGAIYIYITLYYRLISKDWKPVFIFALILNVVVWCIVVVILPESPKWLYNKKKYKECKQAFDKMANFNGTEMVSSTFENIEAQQEAPMIQR